MPDAFAPSKEAAVFSLDPDWLGAYKHFIVEESKLLSLIRCHGIAGPRRRT
jgi:hypothetical protein